MVWVVVLTALFVAALLVTVRKGRVQVRACCPEPSQDLRMRAAFESDPPPCD